jgi:hypothetical protein
MTPSRPPASLTFDPATEEMREMSMSVEPSSHTASLRHARRERLVAVAAAVAAALLVWAIARYGAGVSPRTPAFSTGHQPAVLTPGFVAAVSGLVSLAGWALVEVVVRRFHRPRRVWWATGLVVLGVSLSAPLSGHGVTTAQRIALACMHLAVAAVLIPMFARSAPAVGRSGHERRASRARRSDPQPLGTEAAT